jgi:hypothetical protein
MRRLILFPLAGIFALVPAVAPVYAAAQASEFEVAQNGHTVGTANFQFTATKDGYDSTSLVKVKMEGLDYSLSKDEQLNAANQLQHAILSAIVNGEAVNVVASPDAAQLLLNISASGKSSTTRLEAHPGAVFMADFDAGALETLLALAVTQNNRDLWAILPKETGSVEPVRLATYPDEEGTLEGKPIVVHHLEAGIAGANTELFSGPDNQLLQAELPQAGFALIRKGFVLKPSARPIVPIGDEQAAPLAPANPAPSN